MKKCISVCLFFLCFFVVTQLCVVIAKKIQKPLSNMETAAFIPGSQRWEESFRGIPAAPTC